MTKLKKSRGGGGDKKSKRRSSPGEERAPSGHSRTSARSASKGAGGASASEREKDELHVASDHHSNRRTGLVWTPDDAHGARLHSVAPGDRPLKSAMRSNVRTLEDSLSKADENDRKRKSQAQQRRGRDERSGLLRGLSGRVLGGNRNSANRGSGNNNNRRSGGALLSRGLSKMGRFAQASRRFVTQSSSVSESGRGSLRQSSPRSEPRMEKSTTKVKFSTLQFRWYPIVATDNPGVSKGPAIGAGWHFEEDEEPTPVDVHEQYRTDAHPRRRLKEIRLSQQERERRLINSGVSRSELDKMRKNINLAKGRRRHTLENADNMKNEEKREGMMRKLKKMLGVKKKYEKEEEDLWDLAQDRDDAPSVGSLAEAGAY